ncbi:hypothetical protein [Ruegeria sp. HKCCD8929]|uniref:hypothetical protein n=1 Tax=Ruegeria sp. HKCCD8929 TaxID=2683006 RepID=UPI0014895178|nr:hypothetical protein [Ruegeria sp. HKCCD8929]
MKYFLVAISFSMSFVCKANAETDPLPIDVIDWFDGCAQLTQIGNGMVMDINCADLAVQYCVAGRTKDKQLQCLTDFGDHVVSVSLAIKDRIPQRIEGSTWTARNYERKYRQLVEDVFDVCDASPIDEIPIETWCDIYLKTGDWVQWRYLQRLALEVKE